MTNALHEWSSLVLTFKSEVGKLNAKLNKTKTWKGRVDRGIFTDDHYKRHGPRREMFALVDQVTTLQTRIRELHADGKGDTLPDPEDVDGALDATLVANIQNDQSALRGRVMAFAAMLKSVLRGEPVPHTSVPHSAFKRVRRTAANPRRLYEDFDAAPPLFRLGFYQVLFDALPVIDLYDPALHGDAGIAPETRLLKDPADPALAADCVFNADRIKKLSEDLPVSVEGADPDFTAGLADLTVEEFDLLKAMTDPKAPDLDPVKGGKTVIKMYSSVVNVMSQITALVADKKNAPGTFDGTGTVRAIFDVMTGRVPGALGATDPQVLDGSIEEQCATVMDDGTVKTGSAWGKVLGVLNEAKTVLGKASDLLGLYTATRKVIEGDKLLDQVKFIADILQRSAKAVQKMMLETAARKAHLKGVETLKNAARVAGRVAMVVALPLVILDFVASMKKISVALTADDLSVAVGEAMLASGTVATVLTMYAEFAGVCATTGPVGIALAVLAAIALIGFLLVTFTRDHPIETFLTNGALGTSPDTVTDPKSPIFNLGGVLSTSTDGGKKVLAHTYGADDLAWQITWARSTLFPTGFKLEHLSTQRLYKISIRPDFARNRVDRAIPDDTFYRLRYLGKPAGSSFAFERPPLRVPRMDGTLDTQGAVNMRDGRAEETFAKVTANLEGDRNFYDKPVIPFDWRGGVLSYEVCWRGSPDGKPLSRGLVVVPS